MFWLATLNVLIAAGDTALGVYWAAAVCGAAAMFIYVSLLLFPDEPEGKDSSDYSEMIEKLSRITKSLSDLSVFLEGEKERVAETEDTLDKLRKEKAELEPVVTTQRQTVDAILAVHAARGRTSAWKDRITGFSLGVLSSLIATFIWEVFAG